MMSADDEDVDPLDAFMADLAPHVSPELLVMAGSRASLPSAVTADELDAFLESAAAAPLPSAAAPAAAGTEHDDEHANDDPDPDLDPNPDDDGLRNKTVMDIINEKARKKEIKKVDHAAVDYPPFRKDFYVEAPHIAAQSQDVVRRQLVEMDVQVRGHLPPRPILAWEECGLSAAFLDTLMENKWTPPFVIQRQAVPCIMSGRDVVGIAQTGSGKTLAYLVPMIRHVLDQPVPRAGEGCVGLVIAPTRELAMQVHEEVSKFHKRLGVTSACLYGGANVGDQMAAVRRGVHIVVGTPGRLIDVLAARGGRSFPLKRVTFVVLDEADRLFDMGFEPQVERILMNVRPDRQLVMFSATFPVHVERLARSTLTGLPLYISCGVHGNGASPATRIEQSVELRKTEEEKYARLLQILGEWYPRECCILVFCDSQVHVDELYARLERNGYPCLSLHAGKDQTDRDFTIREFKSRARTVLIATGVAGRGLDVEGLDLVINYHCPNHFEEYIHRVGRTGRAGRSGTAITFVAEDDAKYAGDLIKALTSAHRSVPEFLIAMHKDFKAKVEAGTEHKRKSGYSTKGYSFKPEEDVEDYSTQVKRMRTEHINAAAAVVGGEDGEDGPIPDVQDAAAASPPPATTGPMTAKDLFQAHPAPAAAVAAAAAAATGPIVGIVTPFAPMASAAGATATGAGSASEGSSNVNRFQLMARGVAPLPNQGLPVMSVAALSDAEKRLIETQRAAAPVPTAPAAGAVAPSAMGGGVVIPCETVELNDLPNNVRQAVTRKQAMTAIEVQFRVSLTIRGNYIAPGRVPNLGERKLYMTIEGSNAQAVHAAMAELNRQILLHTSRMSTEQAMEHMGGGGMSGSGSGRYRV